MAPTDGDADCEAEEKRIVRPEETSVDIPSIKCPVEVVPAPSGVTNPSGKTGVKTSNLLKPPLVNARGVEVMQVKPSMDPRQMMEISKSGMFIIMY